MEKITLKLAHDVPGIGRENEVVTLELKPSDVHDPTELPTYLAGYKNWDLRADEASQIILVDKDQDKYRTFNEDDAFQLVDVKGAGLSSSVPEITVRSALSQYSVVDRYVGAFLPVRTEQQSSYDARMALARRCNRVLLMDREKDVWDLLGTSTSWNAAQRLALTPTQNWGLAGTAAGADSDPIRDLQIALENSDQPVSDVWMNDIVAHAFMRHDKVRDYFKSHRGDNAGLPDADARDFQLPGLPPIHVSQARYKGASGKTRFLPNVVVLTSNEPGLPVDGESINSTKTFRVRGAAGTGINSREFFVDGRGPDGGTMIVIGMADIALMTATSAGGIITGV